MAPPRGDLNGTMATQGQQAYPEIPGYRIEGKLGEGGMAEVFRATQLSLDRPVAIKVVHFSGPQRDRLATRFEHEARTTARLEHPGIVGIFEVGRIGPDAMFYAMPLMPHGDLSARIGQLSEPEIAGILERLCEALDFAHAHGVVHRDLKPENVLFDREQKPRLADFGISRSQELHGVTNEGDALGSAAYMSPEQSRGQPVDARSDLYSLGIVAYQLLTGDVPFREADSVSTALAHNTAPIPRLPRRLAHWQRLVDRALAKLPGDRLDSGAAFAAAVRESVARAQPGIGKAMPGRRSAILGLVLVATLVAAMVAVVMHGRAPIPVGTPETKAARESLPPAFTDAMDQGRWFEPAADSAAHWLAAALAESRSPATLGAAQQFIESAGKAVRQGLAGRSDRDAIALQDRLTAFLALHQLGDLAAARHHAAELAKVLEGRLAAAERERFADPLDPLLPLLARTPLAPRAAELAARWHSGAVIEDGDTRLSLVRVDQRWVAFGRTEVSRGDYAAFVAATRHPQSECRQSGIGGLFRSPDWRDPGFRQADSHPVVCVTQADAGAYARWLSARNGQSYRLATPAEWLAATRRAVRATSPCRLGNLWDRFDDRPVSLKDRHDCSDGFEHTSPAGQYAASSDGLSDLVGNVAEWTTDGALGTSFRSGARVDLVRATSGLSPGDARTNVGFRIVRDVDPD